MSDLEKVCNDIVKSIPGYENYGIEKTAEAVDNEKTPKVSIKFPASVNLKKLASEIRETLKPVVITQEVLDEFIGELQNGKL